MFKEVHADNIETRAGAPQIASLLARYRSLAADGSLPRIAELGPESLPELAQRLAVVIPEDGDYRYTHYGRAITEESGVDMSGQRVGEWKSEIGAFFCSVYDRAVAERRPLYTVHRANHAVRVHLWERLVLPVRADDESIRLVVFNKPREYKDDLLSAVLGASPDGIMGLRCVRGADGRIEDAIVITANQRAAEIVGCSIEAMLDRQLLEVVPQLRGTTTWARYRKVVETRRAQQFELPDRRSGRATWFNINAVPLGDGFMVTISDITRLKEAYGELEARHADLARMIRMLEHHTESLGREVSRREALEAELRRHADVDELTGLASRRAFVAAAMRAIAAAPGRQQLAVVALDIDHFKDVNDRHGHLAGDSVLAAVGAELNRQCRASDVVGRLGGEEFAMLLTDTSLDAAVAIAEHIRRQLRTTSVTCEDCAVTVTASFGVAVWRAGDSYVELLARADGGLYRAKRGGRDRVVVVDGRDGGSRSRHDHAA
jgi:diguanylate cyclase (GGDEF)-like protein/PAS domain S-box-containing protein